MSEPSPEVRAILKGWCALQREEYGPDWKEKLAAEMAAKTAPVLSALLVATNVRPATKRPAVSPKGKTEFSE